MDLIRRLLLVTMVTFMWLCPSLARGQVTSVIMDWTATGNDTTAGTASSYEMAVSATAPDTTGVTAWLDGGGSFTKAPLAVQNWYAQATKVTDPTAPKVAGTAESWAVPGTYVANATYYFLLRVCDQVSNCARSNFASKFIPIVDIWPPRPIRNLRPR